MMRVKFLAGLAFLSLCLLAYAAIGPITDLRTVNADIQPDGFTRPAVLVEGTFPGPLIKGHKVILVQPF